MLHIIHIHIPKTAGTSIKVYLEKQKNIWFRSSGVWQHIFPTEMIRNGNILPCHWRDSIKLAVVRDPLDRCVSLYEYMKNRVLKVVSFETFLLNLVDRGYTEGVYHFAQPQVRWLTCGVTHILRFERLDADWLDFCNATDLHYEPLPFRNVRQEPHMHFMEYYNRRTLEALASDFYMEDLLRFGPYKR